MNAEFVKTAFDWEASIVDDELRVVLENKTGHKFPGEIPSRSFQVLVDFPGSETDSQGLLLRKPHKKEDREDNRLLPDERRTLAFPIPPDAEAVRLRLLFKPLPLLPDESAFLLGEWSAGR